MQYYDNNVGLTFLLFHKWGENKTKSTRKNI